MFKYMVNSMLIIGMCFSFIQSATINGSITDSLSGAPINGAIVSLGRAWGGGRGLRDTTGIDGSYTLENVTSGNQIIQVSAADYNSQTVRVTVGNSPVTTDIKLLAVVKSSIAGIVTDSISNTPIAGAIVRLGNGRGARDTTGTDGSYSFPDVRSGNQSIQVSAADYITRTVSVTTNGPVTANIKLLAIVKSTITGIVTDSIGGTPISGAIVSLGNGGRGVRDTTGADGSYSFPDLTSGTQTIRVAFAGYITKSINATILTSAPVTVNVALVKIVTTSVSGVVTDDTGVPLSNVIVHLGSGRRRPVDTTGTDGAFSFAEVSSGTYQIQASLTGYVTQTTDVSVVTDAPVSANISMYKPAIVTVSGIVTNPAGSPVTGAIVRLGSGRRAATDTTGADGAYSFDSVSNSNQSLRISKNGYTSKSVEIAFNGSSPVSMDVTISPVGSAIRTTLYSQKAGAIDFVISNEGMVSLTNISGPGKLEIISLNGITLYRSIIKNGSASIVLPKSIMLNSTPLVVKISTQGVQFQRRIIPIN